MRYRVHSVGGDIGGLKEILCGENTSLEYVGKISKDKMGPTIKVTEKGIETPEKNLDEI